MLTLKNVARFYGTRLIFKDVNLEIRPGTVTLLAGANGAGKSTLLKIMAGLIRPSAGEVKLADAACAIGFLGHQTFIYPNLTALENLEFWNRLNGKGGRPRATSAGTAISADLAAALERVELTPYAREKAGGFSRGMAQRLNLARVLLLAPDLLLLDEPGSGLDTRATAMLYKEITLARERGAAVVWITHSVREDLCRADYVALLENKRLMRCCPACEYAPPAENGGGERREASTPPQGVAI